MRPRPASFLAASALLLAALSPAAGLHAQEASTTAPVEAARIGDGPVIYPGMPGLEGELGENINGPAVIRVPDWVEEPLGRYYMYFAHHRGGYIRLAYADDPAGPWTIHQPGTLQLEQTPAQHHIASPDVIVDEENRQILMYYHGPIETPGLDYGGRPYAQRTFLAVSRNGIDFTAMPRDIAPPYMRAFAHDGGIYGLAMADKESAYPAWLRSGQFVLSANGRQPFSVGPRIIDEMRHAAVLKRGDNLHVFYSVVGDRPERIMHVAVDLRPHWSEWTASAPQEILRPARTYEGADLPLQGSRGGMASAAEHALRDPGVLDDGDATYLYYSVAGEQGIAVARITFNEGLDAE